MKPVTANLIEIYQSLQGEGIYVGEPCLFLRFQDCALSCRYCDTPDSFKSFQDFRLESPWGSGRFVRLANPVSVERLTGLLKDTVVGTLSLTGGEPLQHADFLEVWLKQMEGRFRILLETNGVLPRELRRVLPWVDIISMDLKLPSVTGMRGFWKEHKEFLAIAREKQVYLKVVLSDHTDAEEFRRALDLVREEAPHAPFVLQPVTPFGPVKKSIPQEKLREFYQWSQEKLPDVRVIPQIHPLLGIL